MFASLPEFDFIRRMLPSQRNRAEIGIGDDCALSGGKLYTCDASVEGVHFRLDWSSPEQIIEKSFASNLSDINAMGGTTQSALLGLCINRNWSREIRNRFADAVKQCLAAHEVELIGGDTVSGEAGFFTWTLIGAPGKTVLTRSNARPGDTLYISGPLGGSAAGLDVLRKGIASHWPRLLDAHQKPKPPLTLGPWVAGLVGRGAAIDISDGLSSELHHLACASGVRMELDFNSIPRHPDLDSYCAKENFPLDSCILHGGEEYQLLLSFSQTIGIFQQTPPGLSLFPIGHVTEGDGVFLRRNGLLEGLAPNSWSHLD